MGYDISKEEVEAVEERTFDDSLVPKGNYHVVIEEAGEDISKAGNEMANLTLTILEGDHEGRKFWDHIVLPGQGVDIVWKWKQLYTALGEDVSEGISIDVDDLQGRDLWIRVGHENYDGDKVARIKGYIPAPSESSASSSLPAAKPKTGKAAGKGLPLPK